ncbi:MAG: MBL fold metallo-hydrolase [Planctomycetota bacterium]
MIFKQYYLGCLSHASYLIADTRTRTAIVVDPQRDVQKYIDDAQALGLDLYHVFLTHLHADFVAGHLELRERVGARIYLGAGAKPGFQHTELHDGDTLEFGDVRLRILATPGHTPESISIVVYDLAKSERAPHAVLTGDALFVGDVGRPDLLGAVGLKAEDLGSMLYDSLHKKLLALPDETLVYPAHGAGSLCGKNLGPENSSTIGAERAKNPALRPMSREDFIRSVLAEQPEAPGYFIHDRLMNQAEHATMDETLAAALQPLPLEALLRLANDGVTIVDTRDADAFAAGHLAGSLNIGLGGQYATWAGTVLDRAGRIAIVSEPGMEEESAMRLGRIGYDNVAGFLQDGPGAWKSRPELVEASHRAGPWDIVAMLTEPDAPLVVDVRTPREFAAGHIEGSVNVPLNRLTKEASKLPHGRTLALICRTGYRSSLAASLLARIGLRSTIDVAGGWVAWQAMKPQEISR